MPYWTNYNQVSFDIPEKTYFATVSSRNMEWYLSTLDSNLYEKTKKEYETNALYRAKANIACSEKNPKKLHVKIYYKFTFIKNNQEYAIIVISTVFSGKEGSLGFQLYKKEENRWKATHDLLSSTGMDSIFSYLSPTLRKQKSDNIKPALEAFEKLAENFEKPKENGNY